MRFFVLFRIVSLYYCRGADIQHKAICDTISRISNRNAPKTNSLVQPFLSFGAFETAFGATVFGFGAFETAFGATIFDFGAFEAVFGAIKTYPQKNIIKTISLPYIIKTS